MAGRVAHDLNSKESITLAGLISYGTYIPYWRLNRQSIREALGTGGGRGRRAVASFDEDATTMAVEAARTALRAAPGDYHADVLLFSTTSPPYLDKTNASAIHAALGLSDSAAAYDVGGASRSSSGACRLAQSSDQSTLVLVSDSRTGLPGSAEESDGGDAAAAFVYAPTDAPLLEVIGRAAQTREFTDRWRVPGQPTSMVWEERFGESAYEQQGRLAYTDALKEAGLSIGEIDHLVVSGLHQRAVRSFCRWTGISNEKIAPDLADSVGNPGAAQEGLMLANVLDHAGAGEIIVTVALADGADVCVYRTTSALTNFQQRNPDSVMSQIKGSSGELSYANFLTWRGLLDREPPRRPDPAAPASAPALRRRDWKFALVASRCNHCGTRHVPSTRVCVHCRTVDRMSDERVADIPATISTFTIDRLAFSPAPPLIAAVCDFDDGGRVSIELTDMGTDEPTIGDRMEMTFRRLYTAHNGIHNYFWKARPIRKAAQA